MANYKGLDYIMGEITMMASESEDSVHEQHVYDYFTTTEKFIRTAVPQLVADYLDQFSERLVVEFETYFNGEKMHHDDIARAVADIVEKSIGSAVHNLKIIIWRIHTPFLLICTRKLYHRAPFLLIGTRWYSVFTQLYYIFTQSNSAELHILMRFFAAYLSSRLISSTCFDRSVVNRFI